MEVEQVLSITIKLDTNGVSTNATEVSNDVIPSISTKEKEQRVNGAAADNDDDKMEEISTPVSRSASSPSRRQAKKRGAFSLFRAVFVSFSGNSSMKKRHAAGDEKKKVEHKLAAATAASNDASWKNLVDGMRPLRLHGQLKYYPLPPPPPLGHDVYHDVLLPPPSPARSEGMTSRYASAQDLRQLDNGHEEEKQEIVPADGGDGGCPHPIDMQAEEFIAKFYEQFRLQKSE